MYCLYYQALIEKKRTWFFVGALRSMEGMVFERTFDKEKGIFEFFVPESMEPYFLQFMNYFQNNGIVQNLEKKPNRLMA